MSPVRKIKFKDWYMKIDSWLWIADDFEHRNIPVDRTQQKTLFKRKPVSVVSNMLKNP